MGGTKKEEQCSLCECETCCKFIPESIALTFEGADYIKHFCSITCYEKWQLHRKTKGTANKDGPNMKQK